MKIFSTRLLFLIIPLTLILSCKKDGLTKATQNGANTFSCKINGAVFQPCKKQLIGDPALYGGMDESFNEAFVIADCYNGFPKKSISIKLHNFHGTEVYLLSNSDYLCIYQEYGLDSVKEYFSTDGKVTITKDDKVNYILSGTFEFTAANADSTNDIVTITDGRFDISYKR
jgi:hypothetical protein